MIVAPDKFRGTLSAREAADAMARGVHRAYPRAEVALVPLADGGDGTLSVLREALGGELVHTDVHGPTGAPVHAPLLRLEDGGVFVEMALASGLALLDEDDRDPLGASSEGTGCLIAAAGRLGARRVVVGIGGSASTDGGTGAARALGWRFLDRRGRELAPGGGPLVDLASIERPANMPTGAVVGACDVTSPLLGPGGTARRFAPQKGARPAEVDHLERALANLRDVVLDELGVEIGDLPGGGSGGGLGAGLAAFFAGELVSGFDLVAQATGLEARIAGAAFVVTGEGRMDEGTTVDKVPAGVARHARMAGVPCFAVAGDIAVTDEVLAEMGFTASSRIGSLVDQGAGVDPSEALSRSTYELLSTYGPSA